MIWTGFLLGLLGSFHCLGMCGPIAMAVSAYDKQRFVSNKIVYNLGRMLTYSVLGFIIGSIGFSFQLAGLQQGVSIVTGAFIILLAFYYKRSERYVAGRGGVASAGWLKKSLGKFIKKGGKTAFLASGLINGLLPCGMVYIALLASLALQDSFAGALYMFAFGAGTFPLMLVVMLSGKLFSVRIREKFLKGMPYLALLIGILFILRGSGLGIQSVSPQLRHFVYGPQEIEMTLCK